MTPPSDPAVPASESPGPPPLATLAIACVAFAAYLALAPRTVGDGDAGEFTLVLAVAGVAHPPGYPLFTLLGHAWVSALHALGVTWPRAASSFSALGGAVAVAAMHALATRLTPRSEVLGRRGAALVALVPCTLFAFLPAWTRETTVAEVNSWHVALVALLALHTHRLARAARLDARAAFGWGLLGGLAVGHHPTAVFAALPLGLMLAWSAHRAGGRLATLLPAAGAGIALALTPALWIAWRAGHPATYQWPLLEPTAASVLAHLRGGIYTTYLGGFAPSEAQRRLLFDVVLPPLLAGLAALALAAWRAPAADRPFLRAALAASALGIGFTLTYGVTDPVAYLLAPLLLALLGLAVAGGWLAAWLRRPVAAVPVALALAALVVAGWSGAATRARALEANDAVLHARWRALPIEHGFVLLGTDYHVRLLAWQLLDHEHPAVEIVDPAMLTWEVPRRAFIARNGFDPLAGLALQDDSQLPLIGPNLARQTTLPVIDFATFRP